MNCDTCVKDIVECHECEEFEMYVENNTDSKKLKEIRRFLIKEKIPTDNSISGKIADFLVSKVGTMSCFYFFMLLSTIPVIFPETMTVIGYISSGYLQLILLPLIMVSTNRTDMIRVQKAEREWKIHLVTDRIEELAEERFEMLFTQVMGLKNIN